MTAARRTPRPEVRIPASKLSVNITWMLQQLRSPGSCSPSFQIDRQAKECHTPRRNANIKAALEHFHVFSKFPSGPISRDIAILSLQYPISRDTFSGRSAALPNWCDTLHWYLVSHTHICAIPHFATYRSIIVRYPMQTSTKKLCDTIAPSIARYGKSFCWASKASSPRMSTAISGNSGMFILTTGLMKAHWR